MHEFGKGTVATNRTKHGGAIAVNPPAVARRTFKVPGRGCKDDMANAAILIASTVRFKQN